MDRFEEEQQSREKLLSQGFISQEEYDSMLEKAYQDAVDLESQGSAESKSQASKAFAALGSYKDSKVRSDDADNAAGTFKKQKKRKIKTLTAIIVCVAISVVLLALPFLEAEVAKLRLFVGSTYVCSVNGKDTVLRFEGNGFKARYYENGDKKYFSCYYKLEENSGEYRIVTAESEYDLEYGHVYPYAECKLDCIRGVYEITRGQWVFTKTMGLKYLFE